MNEASCYVDCLVFDSQGWAINCGVGKEQLLICLACRL